MAATTTGVAATVPSAPQRAKRGGLPVGGDFASCLSSSELDSVIAPLLGVRYVDAIVLFRVRVGQTSASAVEELLRRRVAKHGAVVAPIHIRHHWVLGIFSAAGDELLATVVDSAPGRATRDDIEKLLRRMHVRAPNIVSCGRQLHGSNECGIFVVLNAWRWFFGVALQRSEAVVSLAHLRPILAQLAAQFDATLAHHIAHDPSPPSTVPFAPPPPTTTPTATPATTAPTPRSTAPPPTTVRQHQPYAPLQR
ncbi:MAG: hypothetical protein Q8R01_02210, partial [Ramlibacter sp.]|nr:hypothetical protein [Ramlibacter sp.]